MIRAEDARKEIMERLNLTSTEQFISRLDQVIENQIALNSFNAYMEVLEKEDDRLVNIEEVCIHFEKLGYVTEYSTIRGGEGRIRISWLKPLNAMERRIQKIQRNIGGL